MAAKVEDFGPLMGALPEKERDFIEHFFECNNAADAARLAGFGKMGSNAETMATIGRRLKNRPRIAEAMLEHVKMLVRTQGPTILNTLTEVMADKKEAPTRARVALDLLSRLDPVAQKLDITHTHKVDPLQITLQFIISCKEKGWTRDMLLKEYTEFELAHFESLIEKQHPKMIDVTPTVDPAEGPEPVTADIEWDEV